MPFRYHSVAFHEHSRFGIFSIELFLYALFLNISVRRPPPPDNVLIYDSYQILNCSNKDWTWNSISQVPNGAYYVCKEPEVLLLSGGIKVLLTSFVRLFLTCSKFKVYEYIMESLLTISPISLILFLPSAKSKIVINFPGKVLSNF